MTLHFPLHYHPPQNHHGHWSITDATGAELACPHTPPHPELIALLLAQNPPAPDLAPADDTPQVPTPAVMTARSPEPRPVYSLTPNQATWEWMRHNAVSAQQVRAIVENDDNPSPDPRHPGRMIYTGQGYKVVTVPEHHQIIGVFPTLHLRNGAYATARRIPGTKNDPRTPLPTTPKEMLRVLRALGFTADLHQGHYEIRHPDRPEVHATMPSTPSDHRWAENFAAQIRSSFDVSLK